MTPEPRPLRMQGRLPLDDSDEGPDEPWLLSATAVDCFSWRLLPGTLAKEPWPFLTTFRLKEIPDPGWRTWLTFESLDGQQLFLRFIRSLPPNAGKRAAAACALWNDRAPQIRAIPCRGLRCGGQAPEETAPDHIGLEYEVPFQGSRPGLTRNHLDALVRELFGRADEFWLMAAQDYGIQGIPSHFQEVDHQPG